MKNRNRIEMLIGLAFGQREVNGKRIREIVNMARINGVGENEAIHMVKEHLKWCRQEGYPVTY